MQQSIVHKIQKVFESHPSFVLGALFGSTANGTATPESDIDILFDYDKSKNISIFDVLSIQEELSTSLSGKKVDLISLSGLNPVIADEVLSSAKIFYEKR